jgi:hypothetical protein
MIIHRNRLWKYGGNKPQTWLGICRQDEADSEVEHLPRRSNRQRRAPDRLNL